MWYPNSYSFNIHTPYLKQYANSGDGPDGILKRVMTESKLSYDEAKKHCIKSWTDTHLLTNTAKSSFLYNPDREAKRAGKSLLQIPDLAWLIPDPPTTPPPPVAFPAASPPEYTTSCNTNSS
jgi:hypothetical protein